MNKITFLSAQHLTTYYLWQAQVCVKNLASKGIKKENIHALFATQKGKKLSAEEKNLIHSVEQLANVFYYNDDRTERNYKLSVQL